MNEWGDYLYTSLETLGSVGLRIAHFVLGLKYTRENS